MVDASSIINRILKKYLTPEIDDNGEIIGEKCPSCGEKTYILQGGCGNCVECGFSECGG